MSNFGTELKKYINQKGLTVYGLAKELNIDRTHLQHVFTGNRTLKPDQFAKLVNEEYFTSDEIEVLRKLYLRENQTDEDTAKKTQFIFDELQKAKPDKPDTHPINIEEIKKVCVKEDVLSFINSLLEASECKQVYTNLPLTENGIGEVLYYALSEKSMKNKDFKALIYMDIGTSCNNLKNIFIAMELARIGCFVRESSIRAISSNQTAPYFLIADDAILLINNGISSAVLIRDNNLIDLYKTDFSTVYEKATERIFTASESDILGLQSIVSSSSSASNGQQYNCFETRLCGLFHYDFDELYSAANKQYPNAKELTNLYINHFNHLAESLNKNIPFSAIDDFAKTGRVWAAPESYLGRFQKEVRMSLLKKMLSEIEEDKTNYNFINSDKFNVNRNFMFNEYSDCFFLQTTDNEPECFYGDVYYKSDDFQIRDDFAEFINHLKLNGYFLMQKAVIAKLEALILLYGGNID